MAQSPKSLSPCALFAVFVAAAVVVAVQEARLLLPLKQGHGLLSQRDFALHAQAFEF